MSPKKIALWVLALLVCAGFARLGFWQYGRMQEKQALLAEVAQVMRVKNENRAAALDSHVIGGLQWVVGEADMLPPTLLLDNQMREGRPGVHVYCIAQPDAAAPHRLVDFGWVAIGADRAMPDVKCPAGRVRIRGLSTPPPSSGLKLGPAMQAIGPNRWLMTRIDIPAVGEATNVGNFSDKIVRLDPALKLGWQRDLDVLPNTLPPERHLGYAVQWWALSLAVFITALVLSIRKPRKQ